MGKSKYFSCPHCGEPISLSKISKLSRKWTTELFDIDEDDQKKIKELLKAKKIEFGQTERR